MGRNTGVALALAALAAAVAFGVRLEPAAGRPGPAPVDCWFEPPGDERTTCFRVLVPRNRDDPDGATFDLPVAVIEGGDGADDNPAVVMVEGGPGAASFDDVYPEWPRTSSWFEITEGLRADRDVVVFDARGAGLSRPSLDCYEANEDAAGRTVPPGSETPFFERQSGSLRACRDRLAESGIDLGAISTTAMADDIAAIAEALGHDVIDLWAFSFGTRVGLETIRRHPGLVRAAVFDSTLPTHGSVDNDLPWMTWRAFEQLFRDCERDSRCSEAYPTLRDDFLDRVEALNEEPQTLAVYDEDRWGEGAKVLMNGDDLVFYAYDAFYVTEVLRYLPAVMSSGESDPDNLTWFYWYPLLADWGLSEGVYLTVFCRELAPFTDEAALRAQAGTYGSLGAAGAAITTIPACSDWPVEPMPRENRSPVASDAPALFLSGAYDPVTPPRWSGEVAEGFPNAVHLVFRGAGHSPSAGEACATETAVRFLRSVGAGEPFAEPDCELYREPPDFLIR